MIDAMIQFGAKPCGVETSSLLLAATLDHTQKYTTLSGSLVPVVETGWKLDWVPAL